MKINYTVPDTKRDITMKLYIEIQQLIKDEADDLTIVGHVLGVKKQYLSYFPKKELEDLILKVKNVLAEEYPLITRFEYKGIEFGFIPDLDDITFREYTSIDEYMKDPVLYANELFNVLYRPITKSKKDKYIIEPYNSDNDVSIFDNVPSIYIDSAVVFFWTLKRELQSDMKKYTAVEEARKKGVTSL